jgi:hypothetical protein
MRQITQGIEFPSEEIAQRNKDINKNAELYDSKQSDVYFPALLKRLELAGVEHYRGSNYIGFDSERVEGMYKDVIKGVNMTTPICDFYSDLLFGEGLKITDEDETRNIWINGDSKNDTEGWLERENVIDKCKLAQTSSAYKGDAVLKVWEDTEGKARLNIIPTEFWIPITDFDGSKTGDMTAHIVEMSKLEKGIYDRKNENNKILRIVEYCKGYNYYKCFILKSSEVGQQIKWDEERLGGLPAAAKLNDDQLTVTEETRFEYSMLQVVANKKKANSELGSPFITQSFRENERDLTIRATQREMVLDKNANPGMQGPDISETDANGNERVNVNSKYIIKQPDDSDVSYITWNGNLEESRLAEDIAKQYIYQETGTNGAALAATTEGINTLSGAALEKIFMRPLSIVKSLKDNWNVPISRILKLAHTIENGSDSLQPKKIWSDGLPQSRKDKIEELKSANGGYSVISQKESIRQSNPGASNEDVNNIYNEIVTEQKEREEIVMDPSNTNFGE